jgi:hypothetical protein
MVRAKLSFAGLLCLGLAACAAGGVESHEAARNGALSVFLLGLWHGVIAPVAILVEIGHRFLPRQIPWALHLYETAAASLEYDAGFFIGLAIGPAALWRRSRLR